MNDAVLQEGEGITIHGFYAETALHRAKQYGELMMDTAQEVL